MRAIAILDCVPPGLEGRRWQLIGYLRMTSRIANLRRVLWKGAGQPTRLMTEFIAAIGFLGHNIAHEKI